VEKHFQIIRELNDVLSKIKDQQVSRKRFHHKCISHRLLKQLKMKRFLLIILSGTTVTVATAIELTVNGHTMINE